LIDLIVKVRIHESLFGQGNYELEYAFQHLYAPHTYGSAKQQQKTGITIGCLDFFKTINISFHSNNS
jgi:hypothetical protein